MAPLDVVFEVPNHIEQGLASGAFERVGGVIRDSATKQVVAWLRDTDVLSNSFDVVSNLPTPLGVVMSAGRSALSLYDGHLTREAIQGLSQHIQVLSTISTFTAAGQVVNLALSAASFRAVMQRLDRLSDSISQLGEKILAQFDRERDLRFKTALQTARDVLETTHDIHRQEAVRPAINGLFEARSNFLTDFDQTFANHETIEDLIAAQHYLVRAMYAEISRVRCYLVSDEELARTRIIEDMPEFKSRVFQLVDAWLGVHQAAYFHPEIESEDLDRFFQIHYHLSEIETNDRPSYQHVMFKVIDDVRADFWNNDVMKSEYGNNIVRKIRGRPVTSVADRIKNLHDSLGYCEAIIENYRRLQGFEIELRSKRLAFGEWNAIVDEEALSEHGLGIILNTEYESQDASPISRLSSDG